MNPQVLFNMILIAVHDGWSNILSRKLTCKVRAWEILKAPSNLLRCQLIYFHVTFWLFLWWNIFVVFKPGKKLWCVCFGRTFYSQFCHLDIVTWSSTMRIHPDLEIGYIYYLSWITVLPRYSCDMSGLANIFCKGPGGQCFRLCRPSGLCHNCSALLP